MSEVVRLDRITNTSRRTVKQLLEDELEHLNKGDSEFVPKKAIILYLDDENGYYIDWSQAGMKMSECVNLCEISKSKFKKEMGY